MRRLDSDPSYDPFALGSEQPPGARGSSMPQPGWASPCLLCKDLCCGVLHIFCLFFLSGGLSVSYSFLWRSSFFVLPLLLSPAYCLGISGDVVLTCVFFQSFQGASVQAGPEVPHVCLCLPRSPLVSAFLTPASQYRACLFPLCVSIRPSSHGPCSGPVVLSLSCFSSSALPPLCLETLLRSWSLGPCQSPS